MIEVLLAMNYRQRNALCNPCRFVSERDKKLFLERVLLYGQAVEMILTLNTFSGIPEWQMSATFPNDRQRPQNLFVKIPRSVVKETSARMRAQLAGVGAGDVRQVNSILMLNYLKIASPEENRVMNHNR